jgi:hypothetical protein
VRAEGGQQCGSLARDQDRCPHQRAQSLFMALGELKKRRDLCDQLKMNRKRPAGGSEKATFEIAASALCHADRSARSRIGIVILYPDTAGFPVSLIWILARVLNLDCRPVTGNSVRRAGSNSPP